MDADMAKNSHSWKYECLIQYALGDTNQNQIHQNLAFMEIQ